MSGVFLTDHRWIMFGGLFLSGLSDALDGFCARRYHQCTKIGEFIDPLRDRLILLAVLSHLLYLKGIHLLWGWAGVIILLELLIIFNNGWLTRRKLVKAHLIGKIRQVAHNVLIGLALLSCYFKDVIRKVLHIEFNFSFDLALPTMALFSLAALICYIYKARTQA